MTRRAALLLGLAGAALAADLWVRLKPLPPEDFHRRGPSLEPGDTTEPGGVHAVRLVEAPQNALAQLDDVALATPRTRRLAGSVADSHVSYVTRSALWGFPDVTNAWIEGDRLHIHGHLVFGGSDFGVNRKRIEGWLAELGLSSW